MSISGGVSSIFSGVGEFAASAGYAEAAAISTENARLQKLGTDIQEQAEQRKTYQVLGTTETNQAAGGGSLSGSALDTYKSNTQQLSLNRTLVEEQGTIEVNAWREKAASDNAQAAAAAAAGTGDIAGGILSIFGL